MIHTGRIFLVSVLLLGGVAAFGYWSFRQFDHVTADILSNAAASYQAASLVSDPSRTHMVDGSVATSSYDLPADTSLEATSSKAVYAEPIRPFLSVIFPQRASALYKGCTYDVTWQSSSTIQSVDVALINANTLKRAGPVNSGFSTSTQAVNGQNGFAWKVGTAAPARYYISFIGINGTSTKLRSPSFDIFALPAGKECSEYPVITPLGE